MQSPVPRSRQLSDQMGNSRLEALIAHPVRQLSCNGSDALYSIHAWFSFSLPIRSASENSSSHTPHSTTFHSLVFVRANQYSPSHRRSPVGVCFFQGTAEIQILLRVQEVYVNTYLGKVWFQFLGCFRLSEDQNHHAAKSKHRTFAQNFGGSSKRCIVSAARDLYLRYLSQPRYSLSHFTAIRPILAVE